MSSEAVGAAIRARFQDDLDPTPVELAAQRFRQERVELVCLDQLGQLGLPHRAAELGALDESLDVLPPQQGPDLEQNRLTVRRRATSGLIRGHHTPFLGS